MPSRFSLHRVAAATLLCFTALSLSANPWTARQAVATALANNPDAEIARQRLIAAEAMIEQANAAWLPQVSLSGRYTETNSPMMAFGSILNQRAFHFGLDFNQPGRIDNLNATGTVGYNLYSGGRATAGKKAAEAGARAAQEDLRAAHHQLANGAIKALLNLRKAREAVGAVEAGVRAYEASITNARLRFTAGQMLKADLLSLEVQLAQTRETLTTARHGAALAAQAFLFVLGLDPVGAESVDLAPEDPALTAMITPEQTDFSGRPELTGLQERLHAAEEMVQVARGARRPTINAFASYQYDQGWKLNRHGDSWLAGVAVDVNLFDGGQTSGKISQATAELAQVKQMLRKARLGIALEVEQARLAHQAALERLEVSAQTVAQADESAALSRARFAKGALLTAELIGAESRLIEARMRRTLAEADERIALADYHRALGLLPFATP
ncbi:MAG: TolC family protein [Candidatus Didemnitutus sp.]|nr:TolC family protein [Candidatus Didemnitutus sp.]